MPVSAGAGILGASGPAAGSAAQRLELRRLDASGTTTVGAGSAAGGGAGSGQGDAGRPPRDRSFRACFNCSRRSRPLMGSKK